MARLEFGETEAEAIALIGFQVLHEYVGGIQLSVQPGELLRHAEVS